MPMFDHRNIVLNQFDEMSAEAGVRLMEMREMLEHVPHDDLLARGRATKEVGVVQYGEDRAIRPAFFLMHDEWMGAIVLMEPAGGPESLTRQMRETAFWVHVWGAVNRVQFVAEMDTEWFTEDGQEQGVSASIVSLDMERDTGVITHRAVPFSVAGDTVVWGEEQRNEYHRTNPELEAEIVTLFYGVWDLQREKPLPSLNGAQFIQMMHACAGIVADTGAYVDVVMAGPGE